jgi:hypothetical protein
MENDFFWVVGAINVVIGAVAFVWLPAGPKDAAFLSSI